MTTTKKKAAKTTTKRAKTTDPKGRVWVSSGETLNNEAYQQHMIETGFVPAVLDWQTSVPLDRLSRESRVLLQKLFGGHLPGQDDGVIQLQRKVVVTLSTPPKTDDERVAWFTSYIAEYAARAAAAPTA